MSDEKRELLCEICGREHRAWVAASPLWNAVVRGGSINGIEEFNYLCADCFMGLAGDRGIASGFQIRAERSIPLETVTPSGRIWNDAEFAFADAPKGHSSEASVDELVAWLGRRSAQDKRFNATERRNYAKAADALEAQALQIAGLRAAITWAAKL